MNLNVRVAPVRYEEAVLKIEVIGTAELTEPPFDWRPGVMTKLMGEAGTNWTLITTFRLLLDSVHPQKGQYVAYQSTEFKGYVVQLLNDLEFPMRFRNNQFFQSWTEALFLERIRVWERTSNYLIQQGWTALTDKAVRQEVPYVLKDVSGFLEPDLWTIASRLKVWWSPDPPVGTRIKLDDYRYRRIAG